MKIKNITLALLIALTGCGQNKFSADNKISILKGNFITDSSNNCQSSNCQNLRKEFDLVVYTGKKIYCYWDLKKASTQNDFEKIAKDLKNTITDDTTTYEYYLILQKWAGSLQDGHVNAMWGKDLEQLEEYRVPLRLELLSPGSDHETLIISKTNPLTKNLPIGAIVTKINGKNAMDRINEVEKYISGSTSRMRRRSASNMIFNIMDSRDEERSSVKIEYTFKGQTLTAELPRTITLPYNSTNNTSGNDIDYDKLIQAQILPNNIGYLRIDGFSGDKMADILTRTMNLLSHTKALILDVRANGGGNQSGNAILSWIASTPIVRYHTNLKISDLLIPERGYIYINSEYNEGDAFTPFSSNSITPQSKHYAGKVYALTSAFCFSACDTFVSALKENKLATILGEGTGGGTGSPHVFELPFSGLSFRYSVAQGLTAVGKEFIEGKGTLPDVVISPTIEERMTGEDQQLLKAINIAAENIKESPIDIKTLQASGIKGTKEEKDSYSLRDYDREVKQSID